MKRNRMNVGIVYMMLLSALMAGGCSLKAQTDDSPVLHINIVEEVHLVETPSSPYCDFSIDYSYLNEADDSIAVVINRLIQREILGGDYASLLPEAAVDSFKNAYIRDYRTEVGRLYEAEREQATSTEEIPNWFNRTYSLVTFVEEGREGIINATAQIFVDTGGAHPNQWGRWLNFDASTGKLLTKEEVFQTSAKADIEQLLFDQLMLLQADLYPNETLKTLEDLQQKGILRHTAMYIPDNFLLGKEEVSFLFNRYDIAPYSAGEIVIHVPYEAIKPFMKI